MARCLLRTTVVELHYYLYYVSWRAQWPGVQGCTTVVESYYYRHIIVAGTHHCQVFSGVHLRHRPNITSAAPSACGHYGCFNQFRTAVATKIDCYNILLKPIYHGQGHAVCLLSMSCGCLHCQLAVLCVSS